MSSRIAFITHPDCALHDMGAHHPERPARLAAISDRLIACGINNHLLHVDAPLVLAGQLARVHTEAHIAAIEAAAPAVGLRYLDADTAMCARTLHAAKRAAGAAIRAVDMVIGGEVECAFCSVRPPGHHAEHDRAMGFCLFNNIAVGVAHALEQHGLERVAIVDFDVHHGNGTEDIFRDDERVLMVSIFQHPFYPGSGIGGRSRRMVNIPLAAYGPPRDFRSAVTAHWLPALHQFEPQMLFISAGFDAHCEDEMAMLSLTEIDYAWVTCEIKRIAERYAQGRIVSVLEGGYALSALGRSAAAHLKALGDF
ncbi:MAG: histone deacetylase family protein [Burkholderiales bacterium]|nr:histone deacetylase family protein [Burkholderiales bacterium]MDQ3197507.1 histone deacetylase family protein [Pseudomonadota bacterium]